MLISNHISRTRDYSYLLNISLVVYFAKRREVLLLEYLYVFKICLLNAVTKDSNSSSGLKISEVSCLFWG
jgi:hypothetical protein